MARNKAQCPDHKENFKRSISKEKRGFGKNVVKKLGSSLDEWSQRHDPLFKVKGVERHKLLKGIR